MESEGGGLRHALPGRCPGAGYAEADPAADVAGGRFAADKIAILASLAYAVLLDSRPPFPAMVSVGLEIRDLCATAAHLGYLR